MKEFFPIHTSSMLVHSGQLKSGSPGSSSSSTIESQGRLQWGGWGGGAAPVAAWSHKLYGHAPTLG